MTRDEYEAEAAIRTMNIIDAETIDRAAYKHPVTMYILARAKQDYAAALLALTVVDPGDREAVRNLQWDVEKFRKLVDWLGEALAAGRESYLRMEEQEREQLAGVLHDDHALMAGATHDD